MSRARRIKKAAKGSLMFTRHNRLSNKRYDRDPAYLLGTLGTYAPVKYMRCKVCLGRPHHVPNVGKSTFRFTYEEAV